MDASEEVASPVTLVLGKYLFFFGDCVTPEKHPTAFVLGWWAKDRYREEEEEDGEERATTLPDDDTPRYIFSERTRQTNGDVI
tara:strand:- start:225 stop:473 length:249 start_codon:yes stop_codon:yes gene_type:complete